MKISDLYRIARRNWTVKLICLVLAIFIYFFYINNTLDDKVLIVPLQISAQGTMYPASSTPSHVKISLKGREQDLSRVSNQNVSAYLNIDYYTKAGTYRVPIQVVLGPEILSIDPLEVDVDKGGIEMKIEPKARSQIQVSPSIQGTPGSGYEIMGVTVEPSTVGVFGAQSIVDSMSVVSTEDVIVDRKTATFTQTIALFHDNTLVSYDIDKVNVTVNIIPVTVTRRIEDQSIYLSGINPDYEVELDPKMITFTITGNQNQLEDFVPELRTLSLDCSGIKEPGTYELPIKVSLPNGIRLVSQSNRLAKVSVVSVVENVEEETTLIEETAESGLESNGEVETFPSVEEETLNPHETTPIVQETEMQEVEE